MTAISTSLEFAAIPVMNSRMKQLLVPFVLVCALRSICFAGEPEFALRQESLVEARAVGDGWLCVVVDPTAQILALREADAQAKADIAKAKADRETLQAERDKFIELVKAYQKDKDPKQLEQIKAKVTELYTQRLEEMKKKIEMDENNLKERKAKYEESITGKDQEITKKLERITNPPKMD